MVTVTGWGVDLTPLVIPEKNHKKNMGQKNIWASPGGKNWRVFFCSPFLPGIFFGKSDVPLGFGCHTEPQVRSSFWVGFLGSQIISPKTKAFVWKGSKTKIHDQVMVEV